MSNLCVECGIDFLGYKAGCKRSECPQPKLKKEPTQLQQVRARVLKQSLMPATIPVIKSEVYREVLAIIDDVEGE